MLTVSTSAISKPFFNQTSKINNRSNNITFSGLQQDVFESTIPVVTKLSKKEFKQIYPLYLKYRESANVKSSISEVKKFLTAESKRTDDEIFIAKVAGQPAAFLHFGKEYSTLSGNIRYRLKALFVDEAYRGKGVAKALLNSMQDFAGDKEIVVKARRTNEHSPFLYPRIGFHEDENYIHFVYKKN